MTQDETTTQTPKDASLQPNHPLEPGPDNTCPDFYHSPVCSWNTLIIGSKEALEKASLTHIVLNKTQSFFEDQVSCKRPPSQAPFQFTLPVMAALYYQINGLAVYSDDGVIFRLSHNSLEQQLKRLANPKDRLHIANLAEPRCCAQHRPLKAIVYFSWENERRIFLVRRAFPFYYDFLSYSHCLPGWGSLGRMLALFERDRNHFITDFVYTDSLHHPVSEQDLLPYQGELRRIKHQAALTLPIIDGSKHLLGAFLFCLKDSKSVPRNEERSNLKTTFSQLQAQTSRILELHLQSLRSSAEKGTTDASKAERAISLPSIWKDEAQRKPLLIGRLTLRFPSDWSAADRSTNLSHLFSSLGRPDFYPVVDTSTNETNKQGNVDSVDVLIAVQSRTDQSSVRREILTAAYNASEREEDLEYEFSWLQRISPVAPKKVRETVVEAAQSLGMKCKMADITGTSSQSPGRNVAILLLKEFCISSLDEWEMGLSHVEALNDSLRTAQVELDRSETMGELLKKAQADLERYASPRASYSRTLHEPKEPTA